MAGALSDPGIVVEFLGLPGAGKTTLSRRIAGILLADGLRVDQPTHELSRRPQRLVRALWKSIVVWRECLIHPRQALAAARLIRSTRQRSARDAFAQWFNWALVAALLSRSRGTPGVHLFDQGAFQALWSIGFGSERGSIEDLVPGLLERAALPDLAVVVDADLETLEARLESRQGGESRIEREHLRLRSQWPRLQRLFEATRSVLASLAERGAVRAEFVDGDPEIGLDRQAAIIAATVRGLLERKRDRATPSLAQVYSGRE